jgi:hypothetical protein
MGANGGRSAAWNLLEAIRRVKLGRGKGLERKLELS